MILLALTILCVLLVHDIIVTAADYALRKWAEKRARKLISQIISGECRVPQAPTTLAN